MNDEEAIFTLILHSGDARSLSMKALECARNNQIDESLKLIKEASNKIIAAHGIQMELIQQEINGIHKQVTLLSIHAQDHLMSSQVIRDLAKEMILMRLSIEAKIEESRNMI